VMAAANSAKKQRGVPFKRGQSGNPAGKPKGARNKTTMAMQALLDGDGEALTRKAIELAKNGDLQALRLCMDRLLPPRRDVVLSFTLPKMEAPVDAVAAIGAIVDAVASGELTPTEAEALSRLVENFVKAIEVSDLAKRIAALEETGADK
jgi:Family of unknown function (DUF5681)